MSFGKGLEVAGIFTIGFVLAVTLDFFNEPPAPDPIIKTKYVYANENKISKKLKRYCPSGIVTGGKYGFDSQGAVDKSIMYVKIRNKEGYTIVCRLNNDGKSFNNILAKGDKLQGGLMRRIL